MVKIEKFISELKKIILEHPITNKDSYYVHLKNLADSSLAIMFRAYLEVPDYASELKVKEEILLQIIRKAEEVGIDFAFPSSSVYIEKGGMDK